MEQARKTAFSIIQVHIRPLLKPLSSLASLYGMPGLPLGKKVVTYQRQRVGTKQAVIGLSFSPELLGKLPRASFLGRVTSVFMFTLLFLSYLVSYT